MTVSCVRTVRIDALPNLLYVLIDADDGVSGLGETFYGAAAVEAFIHETVAPALIGEPTSINRISDRLRVPFFGGSASVESRAISAVDVALWDLVGKRSGKSICDMLGGAVRQTIPAYNTCAGPAYARSRFVPVDNWGLESEAGSRHDDLRAAQVNPERLAKELIAEGFIGMKIWPFDELAVRTGGHLVDAKSIDAALEPVKRIREAVGDGIEILIEMHGLWSSTAARRILEMTDSLLPYWYEDPMTADDPVELGRLAARTRTPLAISETLAGMAAYRSVLEHGAAGVVLLDVGWCGGFTEAKRITDLAASHHVPVAPHDCSGPVALVASLHLGLSSSNVLMQEMVRAFYFGWYGSILDRLPPFEDGKLSLPPGPGLGVDLKPGLLDAPGVTVRSSDEASVTRHSPEFDLGGS